MAVYHAGACVLHYILDFFFSCLAYSNVSCNLHKLFYFPENDICQDAFLHNLKVLCTQGKVHHEFHDKHGNRCLS
jgi:hypothetical protein